jgi:hypothetical protein
MTREHEDEPMDSQADPPPSTPETSENEAPPAREARKGPDTGAVILLAYGAVSALGWGAMAIQSTATRHMLAFVVALGYATLGLLLLSSGDKLRGSIVRGAAAVACLAFLSGVVGTPSEATALNTLGGLFIVMLLAGQPGKVRVGVAALLLGACDFVLLVGAVKRDAL